MILALFEVGLMRVDLQDPANSKLVRVTKTITSKSHSDTILKDPSESENFRYVFHETDLVENDYWVVKYTIMIIKLKNTILAEG